MFRFTIRDLEQVLGYVVPPTLWISFLAMMAYGLRIRAWYGYMMAVVLATLAITLWGFLYWTQRSLHLEAGRIARQIFDESDDESGST